MWLSCISVCSSLDLSCLGLSVLPGLCWLFPFPCSGSFQLLSLQIFSRVLSLFLFLLGPLKCVVGIIMLYQGFVRLSSFFKKIIFSMFCGSDFHHSILQVIYFPFFCLSYSATDSFQCIILEKPMAPHSSTLAWKIPWMEEPGRLQSMGSLRVGHDWSGLAAAAGVQYMKVITCHSSSGSDIPVLWS